LSQDPEPSSLAEPNHQPAAPGGESNVSLRHVLGGSRLIVLVAVMGLFLSAATLLIFASALVVSTIWDTITDPHLDEDGLGHLTVLFVEITDAFLLGCVLIIVALGLYQLFVNDNLPLPAWLEVHTFDELKAKLLGVVVVLLGVTTVGVVVESKGSDILDLGISVALVIVAISIFLAVTNHGDKKP
jgi:uncharacterized membrane protein YqhA